MPRLPEQDLRHILEHTPGLWEDLRGQSLFLTGGTGFVGTWLLESLLWASDALSLNVHVVVLTRDPGRFRTKAPHLATHAAVQTLRGDMASFAFPDGRFSFVIHAATERFMKPDSDFPLGSFSADESGTRRVLEFARTHGTRRLLFTSSGAVYGRQPSNLPHIPEDYPGAPSTEDPNASYAHAKRISEFMCTCYGSVYHFDVMIGRLFAFVGPLLPLDENYAVGNFIRDALGDGPIRISGDGTPFRSYLYASDLAIWLWTILLRGSSLRAYNVGSSQAITIAQLANAVAPDRGVTIAKNAVSGAPAARYVPSTKRAETELGLQSWVTLRDGIEKTMQWHRTLRSGARHCAAAH